MYIYSTLLPYLCEFYECGINKGIQFNSFFEFFRRQSNVLTSFGTVSCSRNVFFLFFHSLLNAESQVTRVSLYPWHFLYAEVCGLSRLIVVSFIINGCDFIFCVDRGQECTKRLRPNNNQKDEEDVAAAKQTAIPLNL